MTRSGKVVTALLALLFTLVSCDSKERQIVGKWKVVGDPSGSIWEFAANKSVDMAGRKGKYTFGDQGRVKVQTQFATFVYQLSISSDRMTLTEPNGTRTELERVE
jgi:hypothetical protein